MYSIELADNQNPPFYFLLLGSHVQMSPVQGYETILSQVKSIGFEG